jgi:hypothetical protein
MSSSPVFRHVETRCPQCEYRLDASGRFGEDEGSPEKGDASVCLNCGQLLIYDADLRLQKATVRDIGELMAETPEAWATIEKAQMVIRQRGRFA